MIHMHKTIGKLMILYSNYNTQGTNQKPRKRLVSKLSIRCRRSAGDYKPIVTGERERERLHMHKTIGKLRILYSNYNTQGTNQKPRKRRVSKLSHKN